MQYVNYVSADGRNARSIWSLNLHRGQWVNYHGRKGRYVGIDKHTGYGICAWTDEASCALALNILLQQKARDLDEANEVYERTQSV